MSLDTRRCTHMKDVGGLSVWSERLSFSVRLQVPTALGVGVVACHYLVKTVSLCGGGCVCGLALMNRRQFVV